MKDVKIYMSFQKGHNRKAAKLADELAPYGIHAWKWWDDPVHMGMPRERRAVNILSKIDESELVVALPLSENREDNGKRHVEVGYALARKIPTLLLGWTENVFHELPTIYTCEPTTADGDISYEDMAYQILDLVSKYGGGRSQ